MKGRKTFQKYKGISSLVSSDLNYTFTEEKDSCQLEVAKLAKAFRRVSYLRFGKWMEPYLDRFDWVSLELKKGGIEISLRMYLGMALLTSTLCFCCGLVGGFLGSLLILGDLSFALLAGLVCAFSGAIVSIMGFNYYPHSKANDRKKQLESALPTTASYMSAMASAGVAPDKIFASIAKEEISKAMTDEAKRITRDIEALGFDILKALKTASLRSPSIRYSGFLEGIMATITSGGDLTYYLSEETKSLMRFKEEETKEFIEQLGVIAELFMILGVVAPLFFIVMIAIISVISTGNQSTNATLFYMLTYFLTPIAMVMMIFMIGGMETEE
ncbi:MAG: type II secretion system F family protein [Promethearchaeota archaeon]